MHHQASMGEGEEEQGEGKDGVVVGGGERKDSVGCVVFIGGEEDADGGGKPPCVAAGSYDEAVILWDMRTGLSTSRFYPQVRFSTDLSASNHAVVMWSACGILATESWTHFLARFLPPAKDNVHPFVDPEVRISRFSFARRRAIREGA